MPEFKGSQTYLLIPEGRWNDLVPAFISKEAYPDQSLGYFDGAWVRPTWQQCKDNGLIGPVRVWNDTGRVPNVQWWVTKFLLNKHPPFLRYPDGSKGILEAVNEDPGQTGYAVTVTAALDAVTPMIHYLTLQEVQEFEALARTEPVD